MVDTRKHGAFRRMISDFCRIHVSSVLPPREADRLGAYFLELHAAGERPPMAGRAVDVKAVAEICQISSNDLVPALAVIRRGFDALLREIPAPRGRPRKAPLKSVVHLPAEWQGEAGSAGNSQDQVSPADDISPLTLQLPRRKRASREKPIVEFPTAKFEIWHDPETFHEALCLHMARHADSVRHLSRAITGPSEKFEFTTIASWRSGKNCPRTIESMERLGRIERRYRLPEGYFKAKLPHQSRSATGFDIPAMGAAEQRRLAWHLPDDFQHRSRSEQEEILDWVRRVVVTGATDYRKFQSMALKQRYAIRFPELLDSLANRRNTAEQDEFEPESEIEFDPEIHSGAVDAPASLAREMSNLVRFKTATLTAFGYQREGVWGEETALQKIEHLGLMFGALAASPKGAVRGFGVPLQSLAFGMLVFPSVWDWYVQWRERRRGFYTAWEIDMLRIGAALTRTETGWLRQMPQLSHRLQPIHGLISATEISVAKADWAAACDLLHKHALGRIKELQRVVRIHRDPFEPILAILEAESPVGEYRKITEEILRLMPDEHRYPRPAAESVRSFLLLRFGMHLGLRQKNLRQLIVCRKGQTPSSERYLADAKRGELHWSDRDKGWEVFIPSVAFLNANSSYFGNKPFRLVLPDIAGLYGYIERHRDRLLAGARDPGTFFVKTAKVTTKDAAFCQNTFYEAWRLVIQRHGIFNPYTNRGAIKGLLPHGPHNIRDVLATHILKKTGSYEQASYAIQDTPEMVAKHYGRFLPQDKAALAAQILNRVWDAA